MNIGTAREISSDKLRPRSLAPLVKTRGFGMTPCSAHTLYYKVLCDRLNL